MRTLTANPLRIAVLAVLAIVVIEVATIAVPDDSAVADARFLVEPILLLVAVAALAVAGWRRLRRAPAAG